MQPRSSAPGVLLRHRERQVARSVPPHACSCAWSDAEGGRSCRARAAGHIVALREAARPQSPVPGGLECVFPSLPTSVGRRTFRLPCRPRRSASPLWPLSPVVSPSLSGGLCVARMLLYVAYAFASVLSHPPTQLFVCRSGAPVFPARGSPSADDALLAMAGRCLAPSALPSHTPPLPPHGRGWAFHPRERERRPSGASARPERGRRATGARAAREHGARASRERHPSTARVPEGP